MSILPFACLSRLPGIRICDNILYHMLSRRRASMAVPKMGPYPKEFAKLNLAEIKLGIDRLGERLKRLDGLINYPGVVIPPHVDIAALSHDIDEALLRTFAPD